MLEKVLINPTDYWKTNVIGTQRIFEHYKDARILSIQVHQRTWKNPYAMSKYSIEQLAPEKRSWFEIYNYMDKLVVKIC